MKVRNTLLRARSGRFDCCCCCKTKEPRPITDPKGCCCCLFYPGYALPKADFLERVFIGFGEKVPPCTIAPTPSQSSCYLDEPKI